MLDYRIDISLCNRDELLVIQKIRHGNEAVEPIWNSLPAVRLAAYPRAVAYIAPYLM